MIKVTLLQSHEDNDQFVVSRFTGTAALSIGQTLPRSLLETWTKKTHFPRVEFSVTGITKPADDDGDLLKPTRHNALDHDQPY